jgi:hypothetical protein
MKGILLTSVCLALAGCTVYPTKALLKRISEQYDPATFELERVYDCYWQRAFLDDGTEIGIIQMKDGSYAKYWFRTHHLVDDIGGTWFLMSDGKEMYTAGDFCCEVLLPKEHFETLDDLKRFIREHHGTSP